MLLSEIGRKNKMLNIEEQKQQLIVKCAYNALVKTQRNNADKTFTKRNLFAKDFHANFEEELSQCFPHKIHYGTVIYCTICLADNLEVEILAPADAYKRASKKSIGFDLTPDIFEESELYPSIETNRFFHGQLVFGLDGDKLSGLLIRSRSEQFPAITIPIDRYNGNDISAIEDSAITDFSPKTISKEATL